MKPYDSVSQQIMNQRWYQSHQKDKIDYSMRWKHLHPEKVSQYKQKSHLKLKLEVFTHYSGTNPPQCANPYGEHKEPYTTLSTLSLDYIKGGHRRSGISMGHELYRMLRKEGCPIGWQVLCMNCQWIKRSLNHEAQPNRGEVK